MIIITAKTAEPVEVPVGMLTDEDPRNYILDESPVPHFRGHTWICPG